MEVLHENDYLNGKTEDLNDFEHNLLILQEKMRSNVVTDKDFGFMAFLVWKEFFYVPVEERPERVEFIIPEWAQRGVRFKKDENPMEGVVSHTHTFNGSYGLTTIYTIVCGNIRLKWFATNDQNVAVDDKIVINGFTVKDTEDNQYGKSVIINRARLEWLDGVPTRTVQRGTQAPRVSQADREYFERMGIDTN
jgi:hypothetical protein